jgi:hypothetical protein
MQLEGLGQLKTNSVTSQRITLATIVFNKCVCTHASWRNALTYVSVYIVVLLHYHEQSNYYKN